MGTTTPSAEQVMQRALDLGLLTQRQAHELWASLQTKEAPLSDLLLLLVRREFMTNYQVERLVKGERGGYFYGPYKVLYMVGDGAFARVFRASHRTTGEVVAIKVLRNRYSESPEHFNQFAREGRVGLSLRHPNIVVTYDVFSEGKMHFLVMEFIEGWNLRDFVKIRKKVDPLQATRLIMNVTEGLRYAFERGLTHRDLKLNNVLVTSDCQAKLVDFGLAALGEGMTDELTGDLPSARTLDYAALEKATGVRKDDNRSDIYFLGCIYYNMLTGKPPLAETKDRMLRLNKSRFLDVVPIHEADTSLPPWVCAVVNRAMALDVEKRYQSPAAMLADLTSTEARLLEAGYTTAPGDGTSGSPNTGPAEKKHSIMVIESNAKMQDIFREGFKRVGYRVLVTADPERAMQRIIHDGAATDCIIFSASGLGESALRAFNSMIDDVKTNCLRGVLLLDEAQKEWKEQAMVSENRVVLTMPITMKEVRSELARLLADVPMT